VPATFFQLYANIYFYHGRHGVELNHIVAMFFYWGIFLWCMYKSGALWNFANQRVFFQKKAPHGLWLYLTTVGVLGQWWYDRISHKAIPFEDMGVCRYELSTAQRYSLSVLCQICVGIFWSHIYVDSILATHFLTWKIRGVIQENIPRFRDIVGHVMVFAQGLGPVNVQGHVPAQAVPRRRARSWGEEVAQVLE
jgi:hypothetical protein